VAGTPPPDGTPCPDGTVCNGDETCSGGVCTPGPPLVCDDGDMCTTDTCAADTGCQFAPLSGVASICCVLDSGLPECPGVRVPPAVQRRFAKARRLVNCGGPQGGAKKQRARLRKAERALKRATGAASRAQAALGPECVASLTDRLGAARERTHAVVQSLR
jgi:hypothetical protein